MKIHRKIRTAVFSMCALIATAYSLSSHAAPAYIQAQITQSQTIYAVSGLLRSNADGAVIKLVQGVHLAGSNDEAVGAFTREVLAKYPGYSLVDALVTVVPALPKVCRQSV